MSISVGCRIFTPSNIPGLTAWYDAALGVTKDGGNRVSAWANQVAGDANTNLAQATAGYQPLWNTSDPNLNSKPSITFAKARSDELVSGTWSTPLAQPATWLVIGRLTSFSATGATVLSGHVGGYENAIAWYTSNGTSVLYAGTSLFSTTAYTAPLNFIRVSVFNGTNSRDYVNTVSPLIGNAGTQGIQVLRVGGSPGTTAYDFDGEVTEILAYNRALTDDEIESLIDYAQNKYGVSIWTPETITGLVAWYDPKLVYITKDGGNRVSRWANRIGGDTNTNLIQATANLQPLWNANDTNLNGKPSLTFAKTRADRLISRGAWLTPVPNPATWFVVYRLTSFAASGTMLFDSASGGRHVIGMQGHRTFAYDGVTTLSYNVPPLMTTSQVAAAIISPAPNGALYITSKTAVATGNSGSAISNQFMVGIAADFTDAWAIDGQIAQVLGYNTALSNTNVGLVLDYLGAKFGITIGA